MSLSTKDERNFQRLLLQWFDQQKRDLPWRRNRDPYRVWLSEIMLQQTRVAVVTDYYRRFLQRFPDLETLAAAREPAVLAAWSGLGYYRRARALHAAAKQIVREHRSRFPSTAQELRSLPGIGRYTSAAIASIAFDEPVGAVDGNVERVLQRTWGKRLKGDRLWQAAQQLLSHRRPGDFNQAMMELGATLCLPRQPKCLLCPVSRFCVTRGELSLPQKSASQKKREIRYALACRNGSVLMVQRPPHATLMPGMWELPEVRESEGEKKKQKLMLTLRHSITITNYTVRVVQAPTEKAPGARWIAKARLLTLPLTGLARKILRAAEVI